MRIRIGKNSHPVIAQLKGSPYLPVSSLALQQKGEELDNIAGHLGQAVVPVVQLEPGHQMLQTAKAAAVASFQAAAFASLKAAAARQEAVKQSGPHGAKMRMIVRVAEQVEQDRTEGDDRVLLDLRMVEQPEALVQHQAPGRRS